MDTDALQLLGGDPPWWQVVSAVASTCSRLQKKYHSPKTVMETFKGQSWIEDLANDALNIKRFKPIRDLCEQAEADLY